MSRYASSMRLVARQTLARSIGVFPDMLLLMETPQSQHFQEIQAELESLTRPAAQDHDAKLESKTTDVDLNRITNK